MEPIGRPETPISNYHYTLRDIPKDRVAHPYRGRSIKSRKWGILWAFLFCGLWLDKQWEMSNYISKPTRCTFCMYLFYNIFVQLYMFRTTIFVHHQEFINVVYLHLCTKHANVPNWSVLQFEQYSYELQKDKQPVTAKHTNKIHTNQTQRNPNKSKNKSKLKYFVTQEKHE
jgi:hypothetical protein